MLLLERICKRYDSFRALSIRHGSPIDLSLFGCSHGRLDVILSRDGDFEVCFVCCGIDAVAGGFCAGQFAVDHVVEDGPVERA